METTNSATSATLQNRIVARSKSKLCNVVYMEDALKKTQEKNG